MIAVIEHVLVPTLEPGQVVVLDNLSIHRAARVRVPIGRAGRRAPLTAALLAGPDSRRADAE